MSPMPEGWSVDVERTRVVVRVSARPDDCFHLSIEEALTVRSQLHLACLLARGQRPVVASESVNTERDALAVAEADRHSDDMDFVEAISALTDDIAKFSEQVPANESDELGRLLRDRFGISSNDFLATLRRLPPLRTWEATTSRYHQAGLPVLGDGRDALERYRKLVAEYVKRTGPRLVGEDDESLEDGGGDEL